MKTTAIIIDSERDLDPVGGPPLAARFKAALRNGARHIELRLTTTVRLRSAACLAFLHAVRRHLQNQGGDLRISGGDPETRRVLELCALDTPPDEEES